MTIVKTELQDTKESARRIRFEPTGGITATNVQKAIEAGGGGGGTLTVGTSPIASGTNNRLLYDNSAILGEAIVGTGLTLSAGTLTSGLVIGSSAISGGTTNRLLFDNSGNVGELILGTNLSISGGNTLNASTAGITIGTTTITSGTTNRLLFDNAGIVGELILGTNLSISGGNTLNATGSGITIGTTGITGGTTQRILYDNAGVVGELILGTNLSIASGTLNASGGSGTTTIQTLDLDFSSVSTTLANVTGIANSLSVSLTNGNSYHFKIFLQMFTPVGQSGGTLVPIQNGGIKVALGGTANVTYLQASGTALDDQTVVPVNPLNFSSATSTVITTAVPNPMISYFGSGSNPTAVITGVLTCSGTGTLTIQFAQLTTQGTPTPINTGVKQGSYIELIPTSISANTGTSTNRFSPEFCGPNLILSNGNLTVTRSAVGGTDTGVNGQNFHGGGGATGKFYCEFTFGTGSVSNNNQRFGFSNSLRWVGRDLGGDTDSMSFTLGGTSIGFNWANALQATFTGFTAFNNSTVFQMAIDVGAQKFWVTANGANNWNGSGGSQNPSTPTGGISYAPGTTTGAVDGPISVAIELLDASSAVTANFGASAYAFTPPTGYGNW